MKNQQEATEVTERISVISAASCSTEMELDYRDMDAEMDLAEDLAQVVKLANCALRRAEANGVADEERGRARDEFYLRLLVQLGPPGRPVKNEGRLWPARN